MATRDEKARYGFAQQFLNSNKEVRNLVNRAVKQGYTLDRFEYELRATKWYRKRTDMARDWEVMQKTQPREARRVREEKRTEIGMAAQSLGVSLSAKEKADLAERAIRQGWDADEVRFRVGRRWEYEDGSHSGGVAFQAHQQLTEMARQYGVAVSANQVEKWARRVGQGTDSVDGFRDRIVSMAKGKYAAVSDDLDRGLTMDELFDPYRQEAARVLGVNPTTIDVMDPAYSKAFAYQAPGEQGRRAMTLDEWGKMLRTDARFGFDTTQGARSLASELSTAIQQDFGARA